MITVNYNNIQVYIDVLFACTTITWDKCSFAICDSAVCYLLKEALYKSWVNFWRLLFVILNENVG